MGLQLVVIAGPDRGRVFPLEPDDWLLVGRSKATETRLNDAHVSKVHCKVELTGGQVIVTDQGSTGGTFINGRRVTEHVLRLGEVLRVGQTELRLQDDSAPLPEAEEPQTLAGPIPAVTRPSRPEPSGDLSGKTLSHYVLGTLVAQGTTGKIFQALDTTNNRKVAVKVLAEELVFNDEEVQRFVRAIRTMLPLRHPNLVAVYGAGKTGPYCWCAMEFVEGESLADIIERMSTAGTLDWRMGLRFTVHVARALDHAHRHAILHRNLTPRNVMVRKSDQVAKLGDLMLAKALEGILAEKITRPGEIVGDVHYLSPERTGIITEVDARSDLFSLGSLAYALLTGRPPFEGNTPVETLTLIRQADPVPPTRHQPSIPAALQDIVLKLLQKRPEARYQTAVQALQDLESLASAHGVAL
jgi:serine/threonine protein kinase